MRVDYEGRTYAGAVVDLRDTDVSPAAVVRAVREGESPVTVDCPDPSAVHDHVARLPPATFDLRAALAAAARALGHTSPSQSALEDAREELASLSPPTVEVADARRRVAAAGDREARLRERVAELRGRLQARKEVDAETESIEERLQEATSELAESETERIAAEQALEQAERAARAARDQRDRRLELEDRVANLEREVRQDLVGDVWERFRTALDAVPGRGTAAESPGTYDGPRTTAAFAVARLAPLDAPVTVTAEADIAAETARTTLDAPVIYVG
ncbi:hypothetical protein SAMN04488065_2263 [Haloplanus vescus]|uniref:Uncharacterized protein n=1 Tax=Haloplanus vescus TaxID=555874 RepID=A0A1H3ZCC5_9EURY|nr:hypothetical protein [Haloplanus vescus]SEA21002.1 hypothetical protein SAMN04488065_2263 [Haloplanus vescus]